ncbi:putative secreted protein (Por secretion system target) [Pseudobacter ginsenosidimutans]|uniref:Putative secreted protein (Por secretion system target) n=1 Tax=Pseudobacter ginsenosidimutans TaxID=661488 RepID=A0A4V2F095_9BACT|nr:T9SS type A sorting domain-containing protein [Pseudobacter ginsenosidimutans]RZS69210.1 putative secreted protein (Por secretion system target) [Pseudobacter ginsenosidimutans]
MRMRTFTKNVLLLVAFLFSNLSYAQIQGLQQSVAPLVPGTAGQAPALPKGVSQDWFSEAVNYLKQQELSFTQASQKMVRVINSPNRIGFNIQQDAITIRNVTYKPSDKQWASTFRVLGIGREGHRLMAAAPQGKKIDGKELRYQFSSYDLQYLNDEKGLRQNFIVKERPKGGGRLNVSMRISGDLKPLLLSESKLALHSRGDKNDIKLYYDDLKVWDARQQPLAAHMELNEQANTISIVVDDANAEYPVTIDPLNHTPDWTTSADGVLPGLLTSLQLQVDAAYGFGVIGLGDVNGDGFDDIAVNSPTCIDVIGPTNFASAGAVFVYLGAAGGLPTIPSKVLRSSTPIVGALFGFSVAAGDVNGDNNNDIVVGAPLDMVSIDFGGGTGTLQGTVGAVHVFDGVTLTTAPNPLVRLSFSPLQTNNIGIAKNQLFGFSVGVADDMNGDGKAEILVGTPLYEGANPTASGIKIGGAFLYLSNPTNTFSTFQSLKPPTGGQLGLSTQIGTIVNALPGGGLLWIVAGPLISGLLDNQQVDGLLYGWSVDGTGDFTGDNIPDVVVGTPGGGTVNSLLSGLSLVTAVTNALNGQVLGGTAYVYAGTGVATGVITDYAARLQASSSGLLSNAVNLFGYSVKGARGADGERNGNLLVGAPLGGTLTNVLSLGLKAGNIHVFKRRTGAISNPVSSDQRLETPRNTTILTLLSSLSLKPSILYGLAMDNMRDVNNDGFGDIIVGEPLSTGVDVLSLGVDAAGGMAHVYLGKADGTYAATPSWTVFARNDALLSINAASMLGFSVAGAGYTRGTTGGAKPKALVGAPGRALDFASLLNIPGSLGTVLGFAAGSNGLGKAYTFDVSLVSPTDHDGDGVPDDIDVDDDNDGIPDRYEFGTAGNSFFTPTNDPSGDDDADGIPNYMDPTNPQTGGLNALGVGINYDTDGDGIPNHFDLDSDNDGLPDVIEAGAVDANGDGRLDCAGGCDADGDGLLTPIDVIPGTAATYAAAVSKMSNGSIPGSVSGRIFDADGDGVPDFIDIDSDNDGIFDLIETGGADADGNGRVDFTGAFALSDPEGDGWINLYDADLDNDGETTDPGEGTAKSLIISTDGNADGIADAWNDGPSPNTFLVDFDSDLRPNYRDLDSDNDGINDVLEAGGADPDGNGLAGTGTPTVNASGYSTSLATPLILTSADTDSDGRPDDDPDTNVSSYRNGSGLPTGFRPDQDGDTRPNFLDLDSDNDGINDVIEGGIDRDGNGIPDAAPADANGDGMIDNITDGDNDGIPDIVDFADALFGDGRSGTGTSDPVNTDGTDPNATIADGDTVPDYMDLDSDNDGVFDTKEGGNEASDATVDGIIDCASGNASCDGDEDGIAALVDGAAAAVGDGPATTLPDTDGDGIPDYRDLDSDNDGTFDTNENFNLDLDQDNDGRVDGADADNDGLINVADVDNNLFFGGNAQVSGPLPVVLTQFKGTANHKAVELYWSASTELNFEHYELQRSSDGTSFTAIANVAAKGHPILSEYNYTDWTASGGNNYYRLKMIDKDGSSEYSAIILVKFNGNLNANIDVAPNPVHNSFVVKFGGFEKGIYRMRLINQQGQELFAQEIYLKQDVQTQTITRPASVTPGVYWLMITDKNNSRIKTMKILMK